jgi:hypothetical protein
VRVEEEPLVARLAAAETAKARLELDFERRVLDCQLAVNEITRLLEGLERCGYVERASCASDARVTYAQLTDDGEAKLREASETHVEDIHSVFAERFSAEELATLRELLERLPLQETDETDCTA